MFRLETSDSSGPHRPEGLESRIHTMMKMTSQLLEAKSAGRGRQREEEESGETGRGGAHNYIGGAGRASLTADTGYGASAIGAAAAAEVPVHSRRTASEPTRPADDIGRRPEAPAGVGPTVSVYSGEARESHLAGIAALDRGSGVLNPSFHGQPRVIPPVLKGGNGFRRFKHDFLLKANMLDISDHFVGQRVRAVPVGDPLKQKAVLLWESLSPEEIRGAYQAWKFFDAALQSEEDREILKRCRSPRESFKFLGKWYDPENEVAIQHLFDKFRKFSIPQNSNPIAALYALEDRNNQMEEKEMGRAPDTVLRAHFVRALLAEYDHAKETLRSMKNRNRDEIIRVVSTRCFIPPPQKGAQCSSKPPEHAFFSSERGGRSGARRGRSRTRGGGRGSSRGWNSNGGGGHSSSSSASGTTCGPQGSSRGKNGTSSSEGGSGGGSCNTPPGRFWSCRRRGHRRE